jgi:hypothetical protein
VHSIQDKHIRRYYRTRRKIYGRGLLSGSWNAAKSVGGLTWSATKGASNLGWQATKGAANLGYKAAMATPAAAAATYNATKTGLQMGANAAKATYNVGKTGVQMGTNAAKATYGAAKTAATTGAKIAGATYNAAKTIGTVAGHSAVASARDPMGVLGHVGSAARAAVGDTMRLPVRALTSGVKAVAKGTAVGTVEAARSIGQDIVGGVKTRARNTHERFSNFANEHLPESVARLVPEPPPPPPQKSMWQRTKEWSGEVWGNAPSGSITNRKAVGVALGAAAAGAAVAGIAGGVAAAVNEKKKKEEDKAEEQKK